VCWWLWTREWRPEQRFAASEAGAAATGGVRAALPGAMTLRQQMQVQVTVIGSTDPVRNDLSPGSVSDMKCPQCRDLWIKPSSAPPYADLAPDTAPWFIKQPAEHLYRCAACGTKWRRPLAEGYRTQPHIWLERP